MYSTGWKHMKAKADNEKGCHTKAIIALPESANSNGYLKVGVEFFINANVTFNTTNKTRKARSANCFMACLGALTLFSL